MLVKCPSCRTTYKVSDDLLSGAAPAFRCSRCKHTFEFEPDENRELRFEPSQAAETAIVPHSPAHELSLPFGSKPETSAVPSDVEQEHIYERRQGTVPRVKTKVIPGGASATRRNHKRNRLSWLSPTVPWPNFPQQPNQKRMIRFFTNWNSTTLNRTQRISRRSLLISIIARRSSLS